MADPATIAMAAKTAVAAATDKRTWKIIGIIIGAAVFLLLLPILLITAILNGGGEHNKTAAEIVFNYEAVPSEYSAKYRDYMIRMQEAFKAFDVLINEKNMELDVDGLDAMRIKAVFYCLYFGTEFSDLGDDFYADFADAFIDSTAKPPIIAALDAAYDNLSVLIGKPITDTDKAKINNLYFQIKYGYVKHDLMHIYEQRTEIRKELNLFANERIKKLTE